MLLYRGVLAANAVEKPKLFRERFKENGWTGFWTDTIYDYTHFHSNAHEVLGIAEGNVSIRLGGENGSLFRLNAGDMLILPAGVGHRQLGGSASRCGKARPERMRVPTQLPTHERTFGA